MTATERPALPLGAEPYVAAVRSLLWSLPADERDELLDDLAAHLAELTAEEGPPLRDRLGPPSAYASEFVTSAGVAVDETNDVVRRVRQAFHVPPSVRARLAGLRPAWLVLRPFLVALAAMHLVDEQFLRQEANVAELVVVAIAGTLGIAASQRIAADGGGWDRLASLAGVASIAVVAAALNGGQTYVYVDNSGYGGPTGVLTRGDGSVVTNIWAYDAEGNPVDVFLFDQDGRPIDDVGTDGYDERTGDQLHSVPRTDGDGRPIPNLYPREQTRLQYDDRGYPRERRDRAPRLVTPDLEDETTTTTSSTTTTIAQPAP